jgi:hypothetical protein
MMAESWGSLQEELRTVLGLYHENGVQDVRAALCGRADDTFLPSESLINV